MRRLARHVEAHHITTSNPGGYAPYEGTWELLDLRDQPDKRVAVVTTSERLQSLLETGLSTGNLVCVRGCQDFAPPLPLGGTTDLAVYEAYGVILYSFK